FLKMPGVRVVALCDVDRTILDQKVKEFTDRKQAVEAYTDVRKLLDNKDIDAISTATPNHWHALISVWACQAGKDVYVEKPVSHNIFEGRKIVEAARKYNRIVQTGTQNRSCAGMQEAIEYLQAGHLGKMLLARGLCYKRRPSIGKVNGPQPVPDDIDYDLWTGPAPLVPLMRENLHYDWHWVWPTGNGDIGNQGIHQMDICRWATGEQQLAPRVISVGGRFGYVDDGETPNTQFVLLDYERIPIMFEVRGLPMESGVEAMPHYRGVRIGNVIHCEHGYVAGGYAYDNEGNRIKQFPMEGGSRHQDNFIEAVRSRRQSDLTADILEGHLSSALCHMGNISHRLGRALPPEEIREKLKSEPEAVETFDRFQEHLAANGVDLAKSQATLGPWLKMNPVRERFTGPYAREANRLISRDYREPFVVPEKV
ncbi:MAG TPA: Gfo/Idh/MocA family oxidoreductase, partial [Firmicutes bacterium]|nr:Gfo/Idh/MocA family oxidoreductase [Bacillota bacterium]